MYFHGIDQLVRERGRGGRGNSSLEKLTGCLLLFVKHLYKEFIIYIYIYFKYMFIKHVSVLYIFTNVCIYT